MGTLLEGFFFAPTELLLILGVVLLLFGGKKIPEVMHGLGSGIKNFKQAMNEDDEEIKPVNSHGNALPGNEPGKTKHDATPQSAEH